jgi:hypothetical protein
MTVDKQFKLYEVSVILAGWLNPKLSDFLVCSRYKENVVPL